MLKWWVQAQALNATYRLLNETCHRVPVVHLPEEYRFSAYIIIDELTWRQYYREVESLKRFGAFWRLVSRE